MWPCLADSPRARTPHRQACATRAAHNTRSRGLRRCARRREANSRESSAACAYGRAPERRRRQRQRCAAAPVRPTVGRLNGEEKRREETDTYATAAGWHCSWPRSGVRGCTPHSARRAPHTTPSRREANSRESSAACADAPLTPTVRARDGGNASAAHAEPRYSRGVWRARCARAARVRYARRRPHRVCAKEA